MNLQHARMASETLSMVNAKLGAGAVMPARKEDVV
jgi:hypothetical protein